MDLSSILILFPMALSIHATPIMTRERLAQRNYHQQFCSSLLNFNNYFYSLEDQKNVTGIPADLSIHWKTGNIFFTLISEEMRMTLQVLHPSGEFETIKVAGLGQSTTVDNLNDIVYLATDNGVYKYKEDGSVELYSALGEDVMYIAVSSDGNTMYIATWPQNRVQKITNDGQKQETFSVIPNGHGLTLDTRNNIYFVATKTSYILKNGYTIPIKIKGLPSDKMTGVFVSRSDEVFAMDENSNLYTVDPENANAKHIGSFNVTGVNSFAMDSADNVLIGVKGAILKFNAYEKNPCKQYEMYEPIKSATIEKDESHTDSDDDSATFPSIGYKSKVYITSTFRTTKRTAINKEGNPSDTEECRVYVVPLSGTSSPEQSLPSESTSTKPLPSSLPPSSSKGNWWTFLKRWPAHIIGMTSTPIFV